MNGTIDRPPAADCTGIAFLLAEFAAKWMGVGRGNRRGAPGRSGVQGTNGLGPSLSRGERGCRSIWLTAPSPEPRRSLAGPTPSSPRWHRGDDGVHPARLPGGSCVSAAVRLSELLVYLRTSQCVQIQDTTNPPRPNYREPALPVRSRVWTEDVYGTIQLAVSVARLSLAEEAVRLPSGGLIPKEAHSKLESCWGWSLFSVEWGSYSAPPERWAIIEPRATPWEYGSCGVASPERAK